MTENSLLMYAIFLVFVFSIGIYGIMANRPKTCHPMQKYKIVIVIKKDGETFKTEEVTMLAENIESALDQAHLNKSKMPSKGKSLI